MANIPSRVLVYRLGSIGDYVVALPSLHLVRKRYPAGIICVLTNQPVESRAAPAESLLAGSGLVDRFITYPPGTRNPAELIAVMSHIRSFAPDLLVYLAGPRGDLSLYRDYLFFRGCGIKRIIGVPFAQDLRRCRPPAKAGGLWEREAGRLARCISALGTVDAEKPENWDLGLSPAEIAEADKALSAAVVGALRPLGLSIGTKQAIKDWGDANWREVLAGVARLGLPLVLIGAGEERDRSAEIAKVWRAPVLNFCGRLSPRVSAAVIKRMHLFLCHDSGPMHLAAAVGTECVAVFANIDYPGRMFPFGTHHHILFPPAAPDSIKLITPPQVIKAIFDALGHDPSGSL